MKQLMYRRTRLCDVLVPLPENQFIYDVPKLTEQLREERMGAIPRDDERPSSESFYDEDDVLDVDPSVDPSLDRFERTEAIASRISDRLKKSNDEKLKHAES